MARFRIEATWDGGGVAVELERVEPLDPDHAARLRATGTLGADDDPVARRHLGQFDVTEPAGMTPKRVRRAALAWLAEHAGMTEDDSYEVQFAVRGDLEVLARLEAAVSR